MSRDLEYFKDFLADPTAYGNREFNEKLHEWSEYLSAHKGEFDYLKDDEWREIRERIVEEFLRRETLQEEADQLSDQLERISELEDTDRIEFSRRWLAFVSENRVVYDFTEEQIELAQRSLDDYTRSYEKCLVSEEDLRISNINLEIAAKELDEAFAEHYERTGNIPVLTALKPSKKHRGN